MRYYVYDIIFLDQGSIKDDSTVGDVTENYSVAYNFGNNNSKGNKMKKYKIQLLNDL